MMANILARASTADIAGAANPMNPPGAWEFFLSHHQALGGDMMQRLSLLFDKAGKTSWYDNDMLDKSERAMEEGVKNCKNFVLLLTAESTKQSGEGVRVVGITGPSGVGKSSLAPALAELCGGAPIIHQDDFLAATTSGAILHLEQPEDFVSSMYSLS